MNKGTNEHEEKVGVCYVLSVCLNLINVKTIKSEKCRMEKMLFFERNIYQYLQINTQNLSFNEEKWQPEKLHLNI